MCGIAGIVSLDGRLVDLQDVRRMCAALAHRGPDDEGFHTEAGVALGMRRLSIIDVAGSDQPISNEDGTVWVVFNGEIYNFEELRADLQRRGHVLSTRGDTETIVHLYEEFGLACVDHLRGMFAFALWDARRRRLWLARDRVGIKPLFYAEVDGRLVFASELKALLTLPEVAGELSWRAVDHLFTFACTPPDQSIVAGVRKLPPGHWLLSTPGRPPRVERYWDVSFAPDHGRSEAETAEQLRELLQESVRLHLVSDVPVGAFLSGGVDSSAVVATMARPGGAPVKTFSIGFTDEAFSETRYARMVAEHFGTEHHELILEPDALGVLEDLATALDEPFGDASAIPTYMVSRLAAAHVKVVLSGDGGDELFAGYDRYLVEARERRREPPWLARRVLAAAAGAMPDGMRGRNRLRHMSLAGPARYLDAVTLFREDARRRLFTPAVVECLALARRETPAAGAATPAHWLSALQYRDIHTYLPLDILTKVDRMSMAHSLEARVPLLDHRLVEFAATIPPSMLLRGGAGKHVFKRALRGLVPDAVLDRPKQGFGVPLSRWFRGPSAPIVRDLLLSARSRARGLFDTGYVEQVIARQARGRELDAHLWTLVSLELWLRAFIDGRDARRAVDAAPRLASGGPRS
jgi:asparagine synthase (glutamine-hydrolysing)